jgi:CRP-like cAMP-binding protein
MNLSLSQDGGRHKKLLKLMTTEKEHRSASDIEVLFHEYKHLEYFKNIYNKNELGELMLKSIMKCIVFREFKKDEIIFKYNENGSSYFIILKGSIDIYIQEVKFDNSQSITKFQGKRLSILKTFKNSNTLINFSPRRDNKVFSHSLTDGQIFGETEVTGKKRRQFTAKAQTATIVGEIYKADYINIFENTKRLEYSIEMKFFNTIQIFSYSQKGLIERVQSILEKKFYKKGDIVAKQGDNYDGVYLIRRGSFEVSFKNKKNFYSEFDMNYFIKLNEESNERFSSSRAFELKDHYGEIEEYKVVILNIIISY